MNRNDRMLLAEHLTEFPMDKPFEQVMAMITIESDAIIVCQLFEDFSSVDLVTHIRTLRTTINSMSLFGE